MSDIVERLRERSVEDRCVIMDAALMQAAADEIERMRDAIHEAANNIIAERYEPALSILEQAENPPA